MSADAPMLRIVRGEPTGEELAALTAVVLVAGSRRAAPAAPPRRSAWARRDAATRSMPAPGPGVWRASALPR